MELNYIFHKLNTNLHGKTNIFLIFKVCPKIHFHPVTLLKIISVINK